MKWYDRPRSGLWYRICYHLWLSAWNVNDSLYKVRRSVHITRPLMWNTKGRTMSMVPIFMFFLLVSSWWVLAILWWTVEMLLGFL